MAKQIQLKRIAVAPGKTSELRYVAAADAANSCILVLPALGVPANYYDRLLKNLAKAGWNAASVDFQGQGKSSVIAGQKNNFGYHELLTQDIPSAIDEIEALFGSRILLLGHSLGGQLGSLYCGQQDKRITGLVLCTCCSVYFKSWKGAERLKVLLLSQLARLCGLALGYFPGKTFNFGDRTSQRLINDWGQQALTGIYKIPGSAIDWEAGLNDIRIQVLALHLEHDFLAPPEAVAHLCRKLRHAQLKHVCFSNGPELDHFSWARRPDSFINEISRWQAAIQAPGILPL